MLEHVYITQTSNSFDGDLEYGLASSSLSPMRQIRAPFSMSSIQSE